jgi:hypothetical protein
LFNLKVDEPKKEGTQVERAANFHLSNIRYRNNNAVYIADFRFAAI